jgi:hypothetical protein
MAAAGPVMGRYKPILISAVAGAAKISKNEAKSNNLFMGQTPYYIFKGAKANGRRSGEAKALKTQRS